MLKGGGGGHLSGGGGHLSGGGGGYQTLLGWEIGVQPVLGSKFEVHDRKP